MRARGEHAVATVVNGGLVATARDGLANGGLIR